MDEAGIITDGFRQAAQEGDDFVVDFFLDRADPANVETGTFLYPGHRLIRDLAQASQRLGSQNFYFEPLLKPVLLGPDPSHLRAAVTINHKQQESSQLSAIS
jgi:hypothetical protein